MILEIKSELIYLLILTKVKPGARCNRYVSKIRQLWIGGRFILLSHLFCKRGVTLSVVMPPIVYAYNQNQAQPLAPRSLPYKPPIMPPSLGLNMVNPGIDSRGPIGFKSPSPFPALSPGLTTFNNPSMLQQSQTKLASGFNSLTRPGMGTDSSFNQGVLIGGGVLGLASLGGLIWWLVKKFKNKDGAEGSGNSTETNIFDKEIPRPAKTAADPNRPVRLPDDLKSLSPQETETYFAKVSAAIKKKLGDFRWKKLKKALYSQRAEKPSAKSIYEYQQRVLRDYQREGLGFFERESQEKKPSF